MKFNFNIHCNLLFKFIITLVFLNTASVNAEKLDLGPFKGNLSGTLSFFTDSSYQNYQYLTLDLSSGEIKKIKLSKNSIGEILMKDPELSPDKTHLLFTGYFVNDPEVKPQIFNFNLINKSISIWKKSKPNYFIPKYSKSGNFVVFTDFYNKYNSRNIIYDFNTDDFTELPCLNSKTCVMSNWDKTNKYITYINDNGHSLNIVNVKLKIITQLYKSENSNQYLSYPSYTNKGNIIYSKIYKINNVIEKSSINIINENKKIKELFFDSHYISSALTLNKDRYIAFVTKLFSNQSKITIFDSKTKQKVIFSENLKNISVPIWRP